MMFFLDTNICIKYLNNSDSGVVERLNAIDLDTVNIPSIVVAELFYGVQKSNKRDHTLSRLRLFLEQFDIVHFDDGSAECYGEIRASLERDGMTIGWNDLLIAAMAKASNAILVTNNTREFSRVAGLVIEDWCAC